MNNVIFYSPNALILAISKFGNSASYFEISQDSLSARNQQRSNARLNAEILKILGAKHRVLDLAEISKFLIHRDSSKWVIEMTIFGSLTNRNFERMRGSIQALHIGADPYLAKFTFKTLFSGRKSWVECIKWRRVFKDIPASSLLLYESRNRINQLVRLPIEKVSFSQIQIAASKISGFKNNQGLSSFRDIENQFVVFGVDELEVHLEENKNLVKEVLKHLDISNCDVLIKPHPNYSGDLKAIVETIRKILTGVRINKIQVVDKSVPLELMLYSQQCLYFFGVPSSALMAYPRNRFTLLNVVPSRRGMTKRSYLNAKI